MWKFIGASAIFATIIGYLLVNIAIISIGVAIINYGFMNVVAGIISLVIFKREIKASPNWPVTALGACGIIVLVLGLQSSQISLKDPATTVEVVYDVLVLSSVGLWVIAEKRFGLPTMPVWWPDIVVHIYMALLVASRLFLHWRQEWTLLSFVPIGVTTLGYWGLNISIRLSGEKPQSHRATSVAMNILAGLVLVGYALIVGGGTQSFNAMAWFGVIGIVLNVYFLGLSYQMLGPHGLSPLVVALVYDGLLLVAGPTFSFIYKEHFSIVDAAITSGFLLGMTARVTSYALFAPMHKTRSYQKHEQKPDVR